MTRHARLAAAKRLTTHRKPTERSMMMVSNEIKSKVLKWALEGSTGASSKCLAAYLTGNDYGGHYPHDGGDFERCELLLEAVPELRPLLPKMAEVNAYWAALVPVWDDIRNAAGDYKLQYSLIQNTIRPIEDKDENIIRFGKGTTIRLGDY